MDAQYRSATHARACRADLHPSVRLRGPHRRDWHNAITLPPHPATVHRREGTEGGGGGGGRGRVAAHAGANLEGLPNA
jgi:hypothetical protein